MPRTFFQDFTRDDGSPVTVEYSFRGGSEASYSPMFGASGGGDACDVEIVTVMPNTEEYERLCARKLDLTRTAYGAERSLVLLAMEPEDMEKLSEINADIKAAEKACALTDAERERMETWLIEHHVDEPDDDLEF